MMLFLKGRGAVTATIVSVVAAAVAGVLTAVLVPVLATPDVTVPAPLLLTLVPVFVLAGLLEPPTARSEQLATRRVRLLQVATVLSFVTVTAVCFQLSLVLGGAGSLGPAAVRNVVGFCALAVAVTALVGSRWAWLVPTALTLAAAVGGVDRLQRLRVWAWPISPTTADSSVAAAAVCVLLAVGLALWRATTDEPLLHRVAG